MVESLYLLALACSFALALMLTPLMRVLATRWKIMDTPSSPVKTHRIPTPYLGGLAIFVAVSITLMLLRLFTHFPTGTLHAMRGILIGTGFMMAIGLVDDIKHKGLSFRWKFFFQFIGAVVLVFFDIRVKFIEPDWLAWIVTIVWVIGVTNAFNLIDIMDGLCSTQTFVACCGFLFISLPTEEIYVNFTAAAVAGACLGFLPYNLSREWRIFMGDSGSLTLGFFMAALSLGTSYTRINEIGVLAPLFILGVPLFDTAFVSVMRVRQGKSPFLGSKDHLVLKLRALGYGPREVVALMALAAALMSVAAFFVTWWPIHISAIILCTVVAVACLVVFKLEKVYVP